MIPILYDSNEVEFASNGLGRLIDCPRCVVTEERNGIYECEFDYPISGEMYDKITEGCIIAVTHDDGHDIQPFDIYGRSAPLNGIVTFYAHHISYRLNNIILKPFSAESCAVAIAGMATNTYNQNPFSFWTDKNVTSTWSNTVPKSVRAALAGEAGSLIDVYGKGEYQFDKWMVRLYVNRGNDNGVSIRYGVNLSDIRQTYDAMDSYTAVAPYWVSSDDDTVVMLPEGYIASSRVPASHVDVWEDGRGGTLEDGRGNEMQIQYIDILPVALDVSEAFETRPTVAELRAEALRRLNNSEAWLPDENLTVSFVDLAHTTEYSSVAALQRVRLCDKVSVYCGPLGINAVKLQVIKVVYNTLMEMYDSIEIGKPKQSFADTLMQSVETAVQAATAGLINSDQLNEAIDNATIMISGARDSHVVLNRDANGNLMEILIMDTEDIGTAVNVWRWNGGGLGFSSNGYNGPYSTAITADGSIVADMITSGRLDAAYIDATNLHVQAANVDGTLTADQIAAGAITSTKLGTDVSTSISNAQTTANNAATAAGNAANAASAAQASANGANAQTQIIYKSAVSGTTSMAAPTSWITSTSDTQNAWTTRRPVYSSSYPVLFVATQRQTVDGTLSCTTPLIDQTTTVIDGGHITTGSIDAGLITAGTMSANHVSGGTLSGTTISGDSITGGSITGTSISNRSGTTFGFEVSQHGDVAIGTKPDDMSSFDNNKCPFQISNWGRIKAVELQIWAANASDIYERIGRITSDYTSQRIIIRDNILNVWNGLEVDNGLNVNTGGLTVGGGGATITGDTSITGDATVSGSLTAAEYVGITLSAANFVTLRGQLRKITIGNSMPFACAATVTSHITGGKVSAIVFGTVYRATDLIFEFTARQLNVAYEFAWRLTFGNDAGTSATVGTVYRFTGTAI